jgi:hypothetical protein
MMERILFILSLVALLWLYLINLEAAGGSPAFSGSQIGDRAFCLGNRVLHRWI